MIGRHFIRLVLFLLITLPAQALARVQDRSEKVLGVDFHNQVSDYLSFIIPDPVPEMEVRMLVLCVEHHVADCKIGQSGRANVNIR